MVTLAQWVHVGAAVVGVGGIAFILVVLLPSARSLSAEQREILMKGVLGRFRWVSWTVIVLLIASGLGNIRLWAWEAPWGPYWKWLTVKIILAFLIFGVSLSLTIPLKSLERMRARRALWLWVAFVLAMIVIAISANLRRV